MAFPGAALLQLTAGGLAPVAVEDTRHYRTMREFWRDPRGFVEQALGN
jgi:predicted ATPase